MKGEGWAAVQYLHFPKLKGNSLIKYSSHFKPGLIYDMSEPQLDEASSSEDNGQQVIHVHHLMFTSSVFKLFFMSAVVFFWQVNENDMIIMRGIYYASCLPNRFL